MGSCICEGTGLFIQGYEEYELLLRERRLEREKKKAQKAALYRRGPNQKLFLEDEGAQNQ